MYRLVCTVIGSLLEFEYIIQIQNKTQYPLIYKSSSEFILRTFSVTETDILQIVHKLIQNVYCLHVSYIHWVKCHSTLMCTA